METAARLTVALGYGFSAWLFAAFTVYAAGAPLPHPWGCAAQCGALMLTFGPMFSLYFHGPVPLPPAAVAALAVGLIAVVDLAIMSPRFPRPLDPFLSFWNWQLPAAVTAGTVYAAGRAAAPKKR
jgi:hypothetical protein